MFLHLTKQVSVWSKFTIGTAEVTATGITATAIAHTTGPMATGTATDDPITGTAVIDPTTGTAVIDPIGVRALVFGSASSRRKYPCFATLA
jgi:hypothetical protein